MAENTKIEWADHTFNPWEGCTKVGIGCDNCYAETRNSRFSGGQAINWGLGAPRRHTSASNWNFPIKWNRQAEKAGTRPRVFCASLADVFDNEVPPKWRQDLMSLIAQTPNLDWLLLTKRIGNAKRMLSDASMHEGRLLNANDQYMPPPNVWLGATICNEEEADRDIPKLLAVPAAKRFVSIEPMLGPIDLGEWIGNYDCHGCQSRFWGDELRPNDVVCMEFSETTDSEPDNNYMCPYCGRNNGEDGSGATVGVANTADYDGEPTIDWVIVGGESGPKSRPMHPNWVRSLRDQCQAVGVPFFFKQWGEWSPYADATKNSAWVAFDGRSNVGIESEAGEELWNAALSKTLTTKWMLATKVGKKTAGRVLDDCVWDEVPK